MSLAWTFEINNNFTFYVDAQLQQLNQLFSHNFWL